jgi:predicted  nucleic acid-binding Zn-ribbon protein
MNFLDKMKSYVVEEVPAPKQEENPAPAATNGSSPHPDPVLTFAGNHGVVDPKIKEQILTTLNSKSPADWTEFQNQITTLKSVLPDEISAYKATFALFAKKGISPEQMLQDASSVVDLLESQKQEFDSEYERQLSQKVGIRQKHVADLSGQIKALEAQIATLTSQQSEESAAIAVETNKIAQTQSNFIAAYNVVHKELVDEKNKISAYGAK